MAAEEQYDVFVSHAWEDKADFVAPLVERLIDMGLSVWYDTMSLDLGDSLRQNIDRGLAESRYGIVVLSPAFFAKRWPERELNGLVQKAMGEGRKVILPVWHGVTREEVAAYSLPLSDLVAARSEDGIEAVAQSVAHVVIGGDAVDDPARVDDSHHLAEQKLLASAKKLVANPNEVIGIHELADALARDALSQLKQRSGSALEETSELDVAELFEAYRQIIGSTVAFCALSSNLGNPAHYQSVGRAVATIARADADDAPPLAHALRQYPLVVLLYAVGLCALQKRRLDLVKHVLLETRQVQSLGEWVPMATYVAWDDAGDWVKKIHRPSADCVYLAPLSEHLFTVLSPVIGDYFIDDVEYAHVFDIFEYVLALTYASAQAESGGSVGWPPMGRYMLQSARRRDGEPLAALHAEAERMGATDKLFGGNPEAFELADTRILERAQRTRWM